MRRASSAWWVVTTPPSPVVTILLPYRLNVPISPKVPTRRPSIDAPCASAASSTIHSPFLDAIERNPRMSHGIPYRCTGRTPTVRRVMALSTASVSRFHVSISQSTSTGVAPQYATALAVATYVKVGTITSSPGCTPSASSAMCSATVPFAVASACDVPVKRAKSASNRAR